MSIQSPVPLWLWQYILLAASVAVCVVLGLISIFGWHTQNLPLTRLLPTSAPMYYNTALGLVFGGAGLTAVVSHRFLLAHICGGVLLAAGLGICSEYLFGFDLGIDQLIVLDTSHTNPYPGRMSPTTAFAFVLAGLALLCLEEQKLNDGVPPAKEKGFALTRSRALFFSRLWLKALVVELSGVILTTWGMAVCALYLANMMTAHIANGVVNMAVPTAAGFVSMGVGFLCFIWKQQKQMLVSDVLSVLVVASFTLTIVLQVTLSSLSNRSFVKLQDNKSAVERSYQFLHILELLLSQVKDAETGQRGYLLTGGEQYLEPYHHGVTNIQGTLQKLQQLMLEEPQWQPQLPKIEALIEEKLEEMQETIVLRRHQGLAAALASISSDKGKMLMDSLQSIVTAIKDEENLLLIRRATQADLSAESTKRLLFYGNVFTLIFIPAAGVFICWQLQGRRKVDIELRLLNVSLDKKVNERTVDLRQANTALQQEIEVRKKMEELLANQAHELIRSNSELEHFAHVASHDLQEPLRKILAFGDRLKVKCGQDLNDQGRDYLARMQSAAARMQTLINDLLTFSRVTTKFRPFVPVDLAEVAQTIISDMEVSIQRVGGTVHVGPLPIIEADPVQVGQLLQNLISNAMKFHQKGCPPVVRISSEPFPPDQNEKGNGSGAPQRCRLRVEDNGIGFDEQYREQIFQPFQRLVGRDQFEGTGMGLAICKKIVERHSGDISVRSTEGTGTTFMVTLPVQQAQQASKGRM